MGEEFKITEIREMLTSNLKYAPIASVDVEESLSKYMNVLADNRRSLPFQSLLMFTDTFCNAD
jgi:hypothetical protein